jgi:hypothetical protein
MSTREQTRRELRDLAKLADLIPKERPDPDATSVYVPSTGGSRITVPPTVSSVPPPPPTGTRAVPLDGHPSSVFIEPASAREALTAAIASLAATMAAVMESLRRRGIWALGAGTMLVAALVGGLLLGQSLASDPTAARTAEPEAPLRAAVPETAVPAVAASPAPASAPTSNLATPPEAPGAASSTLTITDPLAPTVRARPAHHAEVRRAPKPATSAAPAALPTTKASLVAKVPASNPAPAGHDAFDELIRKAATP